MTRSRLSSARYKQTFGTLPTAMWRARMNPIDGNPVYIPRGSKKRALITASPPSIPKIRESHPRSKSPGMLGRMDLIGKGKECLVG
ncbi:MAG: hypothetical protein SAMD01599839_00380 [Rectinema sp.]